MRPARRVLAIEAFRSKDERDRMFSKFRDHPLWAAGAIILLAAAIFGLWYVLPLQSWLESWTKWADSFGAIGIAVISLLYIVATLALVPGFPMTLAVSIVYGWWALLICFGGGMVAALIAFLIARYSAREFLERFLERHKKLKAIDKVARQETFKAILLARLTPITPFAMENYAFGLTGVRLGAYLAATAVGIVPGTVLNVWIGILGRNATNSDASAASWTLLILGLVAMVILSVWLTWRARQEIERQTQADAH